MPHVSQGIWHPTSVNIEFLLGCSLDGPPAIHNQYRKTVDGAPTHQLVLNGLNVLKEHQVEFNILTLVSQSNVSHPEAVYRYLKDEGFQFHQYIPCVEFDKKNSPLPFAVSGREWGEFLCRLFDVWYPEDCYSISIRHFDAILFKLVEDRSTVCHMGKRCGEYLVVEHNGDVYPCDFFVEKNLKLGNIMDNEWEDLLGSPILSRFAAKKHQWNSACTACDFLDLCNGDCLKHRMYNNNSPQTLSWLCEGWQHFLRHTRERFESLAAEIRRHRFQTQNQHLSPVNSYGQTKKVGRNDSMPLRQWKEIQEMLRRPEHINFYNFELFFYASTGSGLPVSAYPGGLGATARYPLSLFIYFDRGFLGFYLFRFWNFDGHFSAFSL